MSFVIHISFRSSLGACERSCLGGGFVAGGSKFAVWVAVWVLTIGSKYFQDFIKFS